MKKTLLAITASALLAPSLPALAAESTLSANVGVFSDYRFRGVTQTDKKPALQGGFDFAASNGFYVGNWNSSINWLGGNSSGLESDFYIGYATEISGVGIDIGNLYYHYPGETDADTNEI
ncbi:MAG: TorF family putative porin, partial [Burkholderiaceae bacterium]